MTLLLRSVLTDTHPPQESFATPLGSTSPTLFELWCGFWFYITLKKELDKWKRFEMEHTVFHPYPRGLEKKPFAEVITKVALSSQLFKDPECWSSQSLNPWLTTRQTSTLPTKLTRRWFSVTVRLTCLIWSLKGSVHEIETTLKTFTFNIQLYIMDQGVSTTFRILSLTTVRGLMPVLFHRYNVKQSSLESTSNLKTILSMYKVLPVSTSVFFSKLSLAQVCK